MLQAFGRRWKFVGEEVPEIAQVTFQLFTYNFRRLVWHQPQIDVSRRRSRDCVGGVRATSAAFNAVEVQAGLEDLFGQGSMAFGASQAEFSPKLVVDVGYGFQGFLFSGC